MYIHVASLHWWALFGACVCSPYPEYAVIPGHAVGRYGSTESWGSALACWKCLMDIVFHWTCVATSFA